MYSQSFHLTALILLITILGIVTSKTDLDHKQIKNLHLIVIAMVGITMHLINFVFTGEQFLNLFHISIAILLGVLLYVNNLWAGGDSKLFILYTLLLPDTSSQDTLQPPIILFLATFILGLLIILPGMLKNLVRRKKYIQLRLLRSISLKHIYKTLLATFGASWIIFPILKQLGFEYFLIIKFLITYTTLHLFHDAIFSSLSKPVWFLVIFATGITLRILLNPEFFNIGNIISYILIILFYAFMSHNLYSIISGMRNLKERISFAPFLFGGSLLTFFFIILH